MKVEREMIHPFNKYLLFRIGTGLGPGDTEIKKCCLYLQVIFIMGETFDYSII